MLDKNFNGIRLSVIVNHEFPFEGRKIENQGKEYKLPISLFSDPDFDRNYHDMIRILKHIVDTYDDVEVNDVKL